MRIPWTIGALPPENWSISRNIDLLGFWQKAFGMIHVWNTPGLFQIDKWYNLWESART